MTPQIIMDGLVTGSMIGLGAIGVTLTYSILRFANFAHGEFISWGAYFALALVGLLGGLSGALLAPIGPFSFGWALPIGTAAAVLLAGALALVVDALLFGRLRAQRSTVIIMVMASFGAALTLRSLLEFIFTSKPVYYTKALQIALPLGGGIRATPDQLLSLAVSAVLVLAVHLLLTRTAIGRSMRAVSENPALAGVVGVEVRKVIRTVWLLGAGLAAIAGVSAGLLVQIRPQMGLDLLLPLFAAAILGGIGSVPGAMLAGLIVGLAEAVAVQAIGAQWRAAVAFAILVLVLLIRPQGLFGRAE
jgi:branched-chain amino acid transport system permease protein